MSSPESVGQAIGAAPTQAFDAVAAALHQAANAVERVAPRQAEAARLIRIGQMEPAFAEVASCVALWQEIRTAFASAAAAIAQPVEHLASLVLTPPGCAPTDPLASLARALEAVKASVQSRDWVGLADALEYDLGDLAQRWRTALLQPDGADEPGQVETTGMTRSAPAA